MKSKSKLNSKELELNYPTWINDWLRKEFTPWITKKDGIFSRDKGNRRKKLLRLTGEHEVQDASKWWLDTRGTVKAGVKDLALFVETAPDKQIEDSFRDKSRRDKLLNAYAKLTSPPSKNKKAVIEWRKDKDALFKEIEATREFENFRQLIEGTLPLAGSRKDQPVTDWRKTMASIVAYRGLHYLLEAGQFTDEKHRKNVESIMKKVEKVPYVRPRRREK